MYYLCANEVKRDRNSNFTMIIEFIGESNDMAKITSSCIGTILHITSVASHMAMASTRDLCTVGH